MSSRLLQAGARHPAGYLALIAAGEPFRLLFPLGTAIGILGVALWPMFVWKAAPAYPATMHSRIMIEGFLTSFVVGFLTTALPRLIGAPKLSLTEAAGFAAALGGVTWLHFSGRTLPGDVLFFCTIGALVFCMGVRAIFRRDTPPPAFVLVAMGMLCALLGSAIQVIAAVSPSLLPVAAIPVGRLLLNQGYLLLPIMGIGAFLLPRFFNLPSRQSFDESLALPPGWCKGALFAFACGLAVLAGFVLEATGSPRTGCGLRAAALVVYFFREVPLHRAGLGGGSLALALRVSLASIPLGFLLMAAWPGHSLALLHVVFLTGFSLLTFTVASRVVLGHSGQSSKFRMTLWPVLAMCALVTLAMLSRVSADWTPAGRMGHYAYAAIAWIAGAAVWAIFILPGVTKAGEE
jgi:uncharacterized protein involved in response to NO